MMPKLEISQNERDGLWTVFCQGLVVTGLTREAAHSFAQAYERCWAAVRTRSDRARSKVALWLGNSIVMPDALATIAAVI